MSITKQCDLLGISRGSFYYEPFDSREKADLELLVRIRAVLIEKPFYGYRKVTLELQKNGTLTSAKTVRRVMRRFGLKAMFPGPNLSKARHESRKFPYLLEGLVVTHPNHVWATDLTYIQVNGGNIYLMAIIDLYSRKILSWQTYNTMVASEYADLLEQTIQQYGRPEIFNTDQGSQFTSDVWIDVLQKHEIKISMDGKDRALDNIYIERFWRSLKYEDIYLNRYESVSDLKKGLIKYFEFYNTKRFHQSLDYSVPDDIYLNKRHDMPTMKVA
ncbi:MAG: hypothetical protein Ta2B_16180 [Termitinemataceae bacterium]|nr:MAG: hypothetical protein Ta2B_16180 [Termitinemataceae bacterium]